MKVMKWIVLAFSLLAVALALASKLLSLGGQGIFTLVMAALPGCLVAVSLGLGRPFGRLFAGISIVAFLIVCLKTSEGHDYENIMMAAFAGLVVALIVLIKPEKAALQSSAVHRG